VFESGKEREELTRWSRRAWRGSRAWRGTRGSRASSGACEETDKVSVGNRGRRTRGRSSLVRVVDGVMRLGMVVVVLRRVPAKRG
jgi:hypothetical protein